MEQNIKKIKLNQDLAKFQAEIKKLEINKIELGKQILHLQQELPTLKAKLDHARQEAEQKKRDLEHHTTDFHHASKVKIGMATESPIKKENFEMTNKKAAIDRELLQKERDHEREDLELKSKIADVKRTLYNTEREFEENIAAKRDIERELEQMHHDEEMAKRIAANKPKVKEEPKKFSLED
ncbi:MAG: hypothetical protein K0S38_774 [Candidatus Paceibacter sp.]|jgi:hypothetical protein|nr:hypothetical protein [Candidatus Paceibacter sp.]